MRQIFAIIILICWVLSTFTTNAEPVFVLDHASHIQTIHKKNSESEAPNHYQSFSEIDLKEDRSKLFMTLLLNDINDLFWFSNVIYYSEHSYNLIDSVILPLHCPLFIADRQILI